MGERVVRESDISGQMVDDPRALAGLVVTQHPELDRAVRIEALPGELEMLGKVALKDPVIVDVTMPGEEAPQRYVLTVANFGKLATHKSMTEVLEGAEPVAPPKPLRRSHNRTASGEALISYGTIEHAGEPHKGKIGEREAQLVREHLDEINERLAAQGIRTINPENPEHVKLYGLIVNHENS